MKEQDKEQQYQEIVDAWMAGGMNAAEVAAFEQRRREDPELDAYCRFVLKMAGTLKHQKKLEFADLIQGIERDLEAEHFFERPPKQVSLWVRARPLMAYAAAFVLLIGVAGIWQHFRQERQMAGNAETLARQAIAGLPPLTKPAPRQGLLPESGEDPFDLYGRGLLDSAAGIWQQQYDRSPEDVQVRYWLAVCRLQNGEYTAAIPLLQGLDQEQRTGAIRLDNIEDVRWRLAMALAAQGEWKKARRLLREIEREHPLAAQFLEQLKKQ